MSQKKYVPNLQQSYSSVKNLLRKITKTPSLNDEEVIPIVKHAVEGKSGELKTAEEIRSNAQNRSVEIELAGMDRGSGEEQRKEDRKLDMEHWEDEIQLHAEEFTIDDGHNTGDKIESTVDGSSNANARPTSKVEGVSLLAILLVFGLGLVIVIVVKSTALRNAPPTDASLAATENNSKVWITPGAPVVRVEFKDEARLPYSGCYHINEDNHYMISRQYVYDGDSNNTAFGFCLDERRWILFHGDGNPCAVLGTEQEIAHSAETDTYEIESAEEWYTPINTRIDDMHFIETDNLSDTCEAFPGNGKCEAFLNVLEYQYDGGDCCAATCNMKGCGRSPRPDTRRAFPFCKDPRMTTFTVRIDELESDESVLLRLDCESEEGSYNVFVIDPGSDAVKSTQPAMTQPAMTQPAMVEQRSKCRLKAVRSQDIDQERDVSLKYSLYHGFNTTAFPGNGEFKFTWGDLDDKPTRSFKVPPPLLNRDYFFVEEGWIGDALPQTGTIPSEIGLMTALTKVILGKIPSEINLMTALTWLNHAGNDLTGTIPSEIGLMTALTTLYLSGNALIGTIPSEIGLLTALKHLLLNRNDLTGTIPSEIGLLTALTFLWLNDALTGTIPSEIGLLTALTYSALHDNDLTGTIPSEIGLLTALNFLWLGKYALTGTVPSENYRNALTGTIPCEIGLMKALTILDLDDNTLTGTIPSEIGLLTALSKLDLGENALTGTIPSEIGLMPGLWKLFLDDNDLTGTIPSDIGLMTALAYLDLQHNALTGTIPSEVGLLTSLTFLYLSNNNVTGTIPSEIGLLSFHLLDLCLNDNDLTGTIPSEIGLMRLNQLGLPHNALTGTFPTEMLSLTSYMWVSIGGTRIASTTKQVAGLEIRDFDI